MTDVHQVTADFAIPSASLEDCDNTLCPPSSTSAVDCSYTCHCSVTKNISSVNRTFTCSALQGAFGFFWATLSLPNGNTFVDIHSVNPAGDETDLVKAQSFSNKALTNYPPLTTEITETYSYFKYSLNKTDGADANITFSTNAIPCQAKVTVSPDTFTFTWTVSPTADPMLIFTLQDYAGQPVPTSAGTITGQSFTAFPKCGQNANITVVSTISAFGNNYTCGASSALASFALSYPPSAPTNVQTSSVELLKDDNNNTDVRLNTTTWTVPSVDGFCNATEFNYFIIVSVDTTVFLNQLVTPAQYTTSGSTITLGQLKFSQFNSTAPLDTNAVYTLSVIAQSPAGASTAVCTPTAPFFMHLLSYSRPLLMHLLWY